MTVSAGARLIASDAVAGETTLVLAPVCEVHSSPLRRQFGGTISWAVHGGSPGLVWPRMNVCWALVWPEAIGRLKMPFPLKERLPRNEKDSAVPAGACIRLRITIVPLVGGGCT